MRARLREYYWALTTQFGFNPLQALRAFRAMPAFVADYTRFRRNYSGVMEVMPFLHDKTDRAGDAHSEYFLQDLHVAKRIFEVKPEHHVDVGSRIDGFVAHVATFREIEVFDIRPVTNDVKGITFKQADLTHVDETLSAYCDSLSCLHALEHFGLGRYGDTVDPRGWSLGLSNLARILVSGGRLYLSAPIGRERVIFNANWVFEPAKIVDAAKHGGLELERFSWIADGMFHSSVDVPGDIAALGQAAYSLGIFEFTKK